VPLYKPLFIISLFDIRFTPTDTLVLNFVLMSRTLLSRGVSPFCQSLGVTKKSSS